MNSNFEIVKTFHFEAAHRLPSYPAGHANTRLHGHSFRVEVAVSARKPDAQGFVLNFEAINAALQDVRSALDHAYLNEIEGLAQPTLENIAAWIANRLNAKLALSRISVYRDTVGEACHLTLTNS